jgi:hypothetical protein
MVAKSSGITACSLKITVVTIFGMLEMVYKILVAKPQAKTSHELGE